VCSAQWARTCRREPVTGDGYKRTGFGRSITPDHSLVLDNESVHPPASLRQATAHIALRIHINGEARTLSARCRFRSAKLRARGLEANGR
jgi:hypothetical protein